MKITTLTTSQVQDLCFEEVAEKLDTNWVEWFVSFEHNGKRYSGILGACPNHPHLMQGDTIEEVEEVLFM
jgi:hypothetical protein